MSDAHSQLPFVRIAELSAREPTRRWLVDGLWSRAAVGIIGGAPKSHKSWLGLDLAVSVASGTPCLGAFDILEPGPALLYMAEDDAGIVKTRVAGICRYRAVDLEALDVHLITAPSLRLDRDADCRALRRLVGELAPRVLLLDPFVRLHRLDENDAGHISGLLAYLRELQREYDLAVVVVHHTRKNGSGGASGQNLRGSGDFYAWVDSSLYLRKRRNQICLSVEHRAAPAIDAVALHLVGDDETGNLHLEIIASEEDHGGSDLTDAVLHALRERRRTRTELRALLRVRNERLGLVLEQLREGGQIERREGLWTTVPRSAP
jgi:hypothetical protein